MKRAREEPLTMTDAEISEMAPIADLNLVGPAEPNYKRPHYITQKPQPLYTVMREILTSPLESTKELFTYLIEERKNLNIFCPYPIFDANYAQKCSPVLSLVLLWTLEEYAKPQPWAIESSYNLQNFIPFTTILEFIAPEYLNKFLAENGDHCLRITTLQCLKNKYSYRANVCSPYKFITK